MGKCETCKYAIWDYETFYNTKERQVFVSGCKQDDEAFMVEKNGEVVECDRYKEAEDYE